MEILNIDDLYKLQLSSLMWDYHDDIIPSSLNDLFKRSNIVHKHGTRGSTRGNLYHSKVNTAKHGNNSFMYQDRNLQQIA